jgi:O-acetylserine/cysteine efflux transporter
VSNKDLILALLVVTIWGANFTIVKLGLNGVPPMLLVALRFVFAVFPAIFFVRRPAVSPRYWVTYGVTVGIGQFGCLFYAMHIGMPAGVASLVLQSQVFFTLLFAAFLLREKISVAQLIGLCLSSFGLYLVWYNSGSDTILAIPPFAFLLSIAGAAFWGISNIVVRKAAAAAAKKGVELDILNLIVWSSLIPPIPLFLFSLMLDSPKVVIEALVNLDKLSVFTILYLAYGSTIFGFGVWSKLLSKYPASQVAPLSFLVPVTGILTARVVLGEQLFLLQWGVCVLVIIGLLISTFGFPKVFQFNK